MSERYTIEVLASGQPRAYADSYLRVQVFFEHTSYSGLMNDGTNHPLLEGNFSPWWMNEEVARRKLESLPCGFITTTYDQRQFGLEPYLQYLKPILPREDGKAYIWEFCVVSPFTD